MRLRNARSLCFAALVWSCNSVEPTGHAPRLVALTPAYGLAAAVAEAVDTAPAVRLVDAAGRPMAGVPVTLSVTGDGRVATELFNHLHQRLRSIGSRGIDAPSAASIQVVGSVQPNGLTLLRGGCLGFDDGVCGIGKWMFRKASP